MRKRYLSSIAFALALLAGAPRDGIAADRGSTTPAPIATVIVSGQSTELVVRFDKPVNHVLSSLAIIRDGRVVDVRNSRLDAAPNVLFARIHTPPPGHYILRWTYCPKGTSDRFTGEVTFVVD